LVASFGALIVSMGEMRSTPCLYVIDFAEPLAWIRYQRETHGLSLHMKLGSRGNTEIVMADTGVVRLERVMCITRAVAMPGEPNDEGTIGAAARERQGAVALGDAS
jgi:hypothetical protein